MMKFQTGILTSSLAAFLLATGAFPVHAATVFSEDFEDIVLTTDPLQLTTTTPGSSFTARIDFEAGDPPPKSRVTARTHASNPFGAGNQFLEVVDGTSETASARGPAAIDGTGFYLKFDFFEPDVDETGLGDNTSPNSGGRVNLTTSNSKSNSNGRSVEIEFVNGTLLAKNDNRELGAYDLDVMHTLEIVGNFTDSTIEYLLYGSQSVASKHYDVFLNGTLLDGGEVAFRNDLAGANYVSFAGASNNSVSVMYYDNIVVDNSLVPVPEPASGVIFAVALSGAGLVRRRSARR